MPSAAPIDFEHLLAMTDGDDAFAIELTTMFIEDTTDRIGRLVDALAGQDASVVGEEAHAIKGAASSIGATAVRSIALELEGMGKAHDLRDALDALIDLQSAFDTTCDTLRARFRQAA